MSRYDEIMKGLKEAVAFEKGELKGGKRRTYVVTEAGVFLPEEIKEIRLRAGMTQSVFVLTK